MYVKNFTTDPSYDKKKEATECRSIIEPNPCTYGMLVVVLFCLWACTYVVCMGQQWQSGCRIEAEKKFQGPLFFDPFRQRINGDRLLLCQWILISDRIPNLKIWNTNRRYDVYRINVVTAGCSVISARQPTNTHKAERENAEPKIKHSLCIYPKRFRSISNWISLIK